MASRGRERGRGFGGNFGFPTPVPFVLFPEDVNLPDVKVGDIDDMEKLLRSSQHQSYWKASPYFLEEKASKESQKMHLARYSDKKTMFTRDSLSQVLVLNKFAPELVQGTSRQMPSQKKFRWNPESGMKRIELFEQKEKKDQGREDKDEEEKKDEENEDDENVEDEGGEEDEEFGDEDYNQNEYFDDDEDDYNPADDGDDEPTY